MKPECSEIQDGLGISLLYGAQITHVGRVTRDLC
jgi:hypothetical protein